MKRYSLTRVKLTALYKHLITKTTLADISANKTWIIISCVMSSCDLLDLTFVTRVVFCPDVTSIISSVNFLFLTFWMWPSASDLLRATSDVFWTIVTQALFSRDVTFVLLVVWPASYHSPFVLMWHFGCDLHHLSRVFVLVCPSSDQLCFVTMWPFGLDLLHTSGVFSKCDLYISCVTFLFVLLWTLDVSSVIYVVFLCLCDLRTFWIRPSFNKSCFVLMWPSLHQLRYRPPRL